MHLYFNICNSKQICNFCIDGEIKYKNCNCMYVHEDVLE